MNDILLLLLIVFMLRVSWAFWSWYKKGKTKWYL